MRRKKREMHYIITMQKPHAAGFAVSTKEGAIAAGPDATRQQIYHDVVKGLGPEWATASTMFFSLEPNKPDGRA